MYEKFQMETSRQKNWAKNLGKMKYFPKLANIMTVILLFFVGTKRYRKYRSLGTPPRLTFQARLLHNQEDVNTDRYV